MAETGWSKEFPTVDGIYWWRADATDLDPDAHFVQGEFFYQVGFASSGFGDNFGGEWLGPISPSDFEQLRRLRKAAEAAILALEMATFGELDATGERAKRLLREALARKEEKT